MNKEIKQKITLKEIVLNPDFWIGFGTCMWLIMIVLSIKLLILK